MNMNMNMKQVYMEGMRKAMTGYVKYT